MWDEQNDSSDDSDGSDSDSDSDSHPPQQKAAEPLTSPKTPDSNLPGPTAYFKISNITIPSDIANHGKSTGHIPELILNNFTTRLGRRTGRFLGSLFPHVPELRGRQVVTFHNQRDYIFVRHHRYVFKPGSAPASDDAKKEGGKKSKTSAKLQELGPRFSMKMRWLLEGGFDTKYGEYEWYHHRKEQDETRTTFHL